MERVTVALTVCGALLLCGSSVADKKERDVDIYSFHINSTVNSRYGVTIITSRVANRLNQSKEIHFQVKIPKNAFISKFRMTIEGKTYDGVVKQKEEAQQQYDAARSRGESTGIVGSVGRTLEEFKTSVTVAALSKVTFELTYEELLKRRLGKYELRIHAQPMQPVADFKIDVYINEDTGISSLEVKGELKTQALSSAAIKTVADSNKEAWVNFYPTREQQTNCDSCGKDGLHGDLIVEYDVQRPNQLGELKASAGYFAHYFAPTDIQQIPKNVVFIIDRSGSMHGRKMAQTRLAMLKILGDLHEDDYFGLIIFDSQVEVWKAELLPATERNLNHAKEFVKKINDRGATDINAAVLQGVQMINKYPREGSASMLILLTDGDPTSGETNTGRIQANIKQAIGGTFPLYCLGFGFDVNFDFLEKMAVENDGVAQRIYEASDADLQLQGFYEEVATPLLTDVQLKYPGAANLTQTSFRRYYNGSEIVVAGKISDNNLETFQMEVLAVSKNRNVTYQDAVSAKDVAAVSPQHEGFVQRLWAYLTVKQLLDKEVALKGEEKEIAKKAALDLSLKYEFVTPLTSMVVTKPQGEESQVAHKPKEGEKHEEAKPPIRYDMPVPNQHTNYFSGINRHAVGGIAVPARHPAIGGVMPGSSNVLIGERGTLGQPGSHIMLHMAYDNVPEEEEADMLLARADSLEPMATFQPEILTTATPTTVSAVRFLISGQNKPICYDIPAGHKLRLFFDSSSDISVNGHISDNGFSLVTIRSKTATLVVTPVESVYSDSEGSVKFVWGQLDPSRHESDHVSVFQRSNELDVTMGTVRVVILLHNKNRDAFLWPVVHQPKNDANISGILGKTDLQYQSLPGSKLKMNQQEVEASESSAFDYRFPLAPSVQCWLVPSQFALQGDLSDFTVSQL